MKKWMILVLVTLFILPSAYAGFGLFGSWWGPKDYDDLFGGGIRIAGELFSGIGLEARASYLSSNITKDPDVTMDLIPIEGIVSWVLDISEDIKPYIGAGIGYYIKNPDWGSNELGDEIISKDCVGYFALGGINILLGEVMLFAEGKYNLISDDDELEWRGSAIRETYSLDGFSANLGLKWGF